MVSSMERRNQRYGFESLDTMTGFFSKWIPSMEIEGLVKEAEKRFQPRENCTDEETRLQKIQKAEFAIVKRLVDKNPYLP